LLEVNSELPFARRVRSQLAHPLTELAALYLVGALADAPASARWDASDVADRTISATATGMRLLYIMSSLAGLRSKHFDGPGKLIVIKMLRNPPMRKHRIKTCANAEGAHPVRFVRRTMAHPVDWARSGLRPPPQLRLQACQ
jgi:hypothetical protein